MSRAGRVLWSVAAQVLSSASNSVVQFGLLLCLPAADFGAVVIGLAFWFLALFLGRAAVGDPLVALSGAVREGDSRRPLVDGAWPRSRRRLLGAGLVAGAVIVGWAGVTSRTGVRAELVLLGLATPALVLQDGYRYLFWARHQPRRVVAVDGTWLAVAAASAGAVAAGWGPAGADRAVLVLAGWLAGGVVSCGLAALAAGPTPAGPDLVGPAATTPQPAGPARLRSLSRSQVVLAVESNALPVAVAAAAGSVVTAGLRAALLPFLPVTTVTGALRMLALPELRAGADGGRLRPAVLRVVTIYAVVAAGMGATGLAVVHTVPPAWLGDTGRSVLAWYWLAALVMAARAVNVGLGDALSLRAGSRRVLTVRLATSGLDWAGTLVGAAAGGVPGALAGRALAGAAGGGMWAMALAVGAPGVEAGPSPRVEVAPVGSEV